MRWWCSSPWLPPWRCRWTDAEFYAATSYLEAHGRNVVNVVLVDYRAIDTLGEVVVVAFAAISVWGLLRALPRRRDSR